MATPAEIIETIGRGRIIAILRGDFKSREVEIVAALLEAGVTAVEMTLNSPGAIEGIARLVKQFGSRAAIGAGTVLRIEEVQKVADVGAAFVVSPNRNIRVIGATKSKGLVSIPGCFTPSEAVEAVEAGADAVKLFPALALGPSGVKAIRGPLPDIRLVPTGGVDPDAARRYFAAGAWAVGVGSELVNADALSPGGIDSLRTRAIAFASGVRES